MNSEERRVRRWSLRDYKKGYWAGPQGKDFPLVVYIAPRKGDFLVDFIFDEISKSYYISAVGHDSSSYTHWVNLLVKVIGETYEF